MQPKGSRIPLHWNENVENEYRNFVEEKQIKILTKCWDGHFISPVIITLKLDQTIKNAPASKILNDTIHKNKYQMQSIDHITDRIATRMSELKTTQGSYATAKKI